MDDKSKKLIDEIEKLIDEIKKYWWLISPISTFVIFLLLKHIINITTLMQKNEELILLGPKGSRLRWDIEEIKKNKIGQFNNILYNTWYYKYYKKFERCYRDKSL